MLLQELFQADREALRANLERDRSPAAAQAALEKEVDRLIYLSLSEIPAGPAREAAECALESVKMTLPLMDVVREAHTWNREVSRSEKNPFSKKALMLLIAGIVLILAGTLSAFFSISGLLNPLALIRALVPAAGGAAAIFFAGMLKNRPAKAAEERAPLTRTEFYIDPEEVLRRFSTLLMLADNLIDKAHARGEVEAVKAMPAIQVPPSESEFYAELLEKAYALPAEDRAEIGAAIRYYLHTHGIAAVDYAEGNETLFEFLPGQKTSTIRPALTQSGKVLQKGLAELGKDAMHG